MKRILYLSIITILVTFDYFNAQNTDLGVSAGEGALQGKSVHIGTNAGLRDWGRSSTIIGWKAGIRNYGPYNIFIGVRAGGEINRGFHNVNIGAGSGYSNTTGSLNANVGHNSGWANTSGSRNAFLGAESGRWNTTGTRNTYLGNRSGFFSTTANDNVFLGNYSGYQNKTGSQNVYIGSYSGKSVKGSGNICIGYNSAPIISGDNNLVIHNGYTAFPLIRGYFKDKKLIFNGKVGINTSRFPNSIGGANISHYQLYVKGGLLTEEIRVVTGGWADYVFDEDYSLLDLSEVAQYIEKNKHLPNMPSEKEVIAQGINVSEMTRMQQEKIEELTLYIIQQEEKIEQLNKEKELQNVTNSELLKSLNDQEMRIQKLENLIKNQN